MFVIEEGKTRNIEPVNMLTLLPSEILSTILEYVVAGDVPLDPSKVVSNVPPDASRDRPESSDASDWIITTSISKRLRLLGKRAYFAQKHFIVSPNLLDQFIQVKREAPAAEGAEVDNLDLFFEHARYIIASMPGCSAASAFLTLPRYPASLANRRYLTLWPGLRSPEIYPCPENRALVREPATEELRGLLQGIGLDVSRVRVEVVYSRTQLIRENDVLQLRNTVFPYLRFVGNQRAKKNRSLAL
ncbi:MAG: hypothetical protein Q9208_004371 [Pyrenodesmia sp. 3 TL-2023]